MFFYSRLTSKRRQHGRPLVSHKAGERVQKVIGERIQGYGKGARQETSSRQSLSRMNIGGFKREEAMKELDELKKILDEVLLHIREPKARAHFEKIFRLVYSGIQGGGIRSLKDVQGFFMTLFRRKPQNAEEAQEIQKLMQGFKSPEEAAIGFTRGFARFFQEGSGQTKKLNEKFFELARIARQ